MWRFLLQSMLQHERSMDCSIFALVPGNTLLAMHFLQVRVPLSLDGGRNLAALHHITVQGNADESGQT